MLNRGLKVLNEEEQQMGKVVGVLTALGDSASMTAASIEDMSRRIAAATLESTTGVMQAAATLSTFTSIAQKDFERVLMLGADMTSLLGGNLQSAVQRLGRALEDPATGMQRLARVGVVLDAAQEEAIESMIAMGDAAGAQEYLLKQLETRFDGVAEAAGSGMAGAFDLLGQRMDEFASKVASESGAGKQITKWVTGIANRLEAISNFVFPDTLDDLDAKIARITENMGKTTRMAERHGEEQLKALEKQRIEMLVAEEEADQKLIEQDEKSSAIRAAKRKKAAAAEAQELADKYDILLAKTKAHTIQLESLGVEDKEEKENLKLQRELTRLEERQRVYRKDYGVRLEMEAEFLRQREALIEGHTMRVSEIRKTAEEEMIEYFDEVQNRQTAQIQKAIKDEIKALEAKEKMHLAVAGTVSAAAGLAASALEEGSTAQRIALGIEKAAAVSSVLMSTQVAIMKAAALAPGPAKYAAIAEAIAMGGSVLSTLQSIDISGSRALGGPIGRSGNYWVGEHGKELVTLPQGASVASNDDITKTPEVNLTIIEDKSRAGQVEQSDDQLRVFVDTFKSQMIDDISKGRGVASAMERRYGLRRQNG